MEEEEVGREEYEVGEEREDNIFYALMWRAIINFLAPEVFASVLLSVLLYLVTSNLLGPCPYHSELALLYREAEDAPLPA